MLEWSAFGVICEVPKKKRRVRPAVVERPRPRLRGKRADRPARPQESSRIRWGDFTY